MSLETAEIATPLFESTGLMKDPKQAAATSMHLLAVGDKGAHYLSDTMFYSFGTANHLQDIAFIIQKRFGRRGTADTVSVAFTLMGTSSRTARNCFL